MPPRYRGRAGHGTANTHARARSQPPSVRYHWRSSERSGGVIGARASASAAAVSPKPGRSAGTGTGIIQQRRHGAMSSSPNEASSPSAAAAAAAASISYSSASSPIVTRVSPMRSRSQPAVPRKRMTPRPRRNSGSQQHGKDSLLVDSPLGTSMDAPARRMRSGIAATAAAAAAAAVEAAAGAGGRSKSQPAASTRKRTAMPHRRAAAAGEVSSVGRAGDGGTTDRGAPAAHSNHHHSAPISPRTYTAAANPKPPVRTTPKTKPPATPGRIPRDTRSYQTSVTNVKVWV